MCDSCALIAIANSLSDFFALAAPLQLATEKAVRFDVDPRIKVKTVGNSTILKYAVRRAGRKGAQDPLHHSTQKLPS